MEARQVNVHGRSRRFLMAGEGPALVLIHGIAGTSETWIPVMERLSEHMTVLAPDLFGEGPPASGTDFSLGALAAGVRDLLVVVGLDGATVVGHSLGGGVAMQFAYQFPERTDRLVLVSSGGLGREVNGWLRALSVPGAEYLIAAACSRRIVSAGDAFRNLFGKLGLDLSASATEIWRSYSSLGDAGTRAAFVNTLRAVIDVSGQRVSAEDRLYLASHIPTLIAWGKRDPVIPVAHAHGAHAAIPGSRLQIFERSGHFPHRDDPVSFAALLKEFVESTEPAALSAARLREVIEARQ